MPPSSTAARRAALATLLAGGALAGAASAALAQDPPLPPPPEVSAVTIADGQVDAAVGRLDGIAQELMARTGIPGMAIAVVHDDEVVYAKGFGTGHAGADRPVDADTVFQIASLSKPLGATAVARAMDGKRVSWTDPVRRWLPGFRLSSPTSTREVTIADLYSHRSGLPDHAGDLLEDLGYGRAEVLRRLRYLPVTPIRTEYAYTNFGLTAGAVAVARAQGTSWERLMERELYRPLGMTASSSTYAGYRAATNRADLHVQTGERAWEARHRRDPDAQSPAGGVSSSVADMARWMRVVLAGGTLDGERVVSAKGILELVTPHALSGPPISLPARSSFYGLGIGTGTDATGRVRLSHSGAFALGAGTNFALLPSEDLGIVVLTNAQPIGVAEAVSSTFLDLVETGSVERDWYEAYHARLAPMLESHGELADKERPRGARRTRAASVYAGTYANRYYGPARITARGGRLTMRLGPKGRFPLTHWSGDTFSYVPAGENATGIASVRFTVPRGAQRARMVRVENLDAEGLGTFRRR